MIQSRLKLLYGVNEADSWWHFAIGPQREQIWARLRELDVRIVRIFLYQKGTPDPVSDWKTFAAYVQAVLNLGAIPMVTFAQFPEAFDNARAIRAFATRCGDVVWSALEHWGPTMVREWMWGVWNEPNNTWIGGGVTFEQYRAIYEAVAEQIGRWLGPIGAGSPMRLGGPSVEGFQPFWLDWIWRFVDEIDHASIGFVNWHLYADWRDDGEGGAPAEPAMHRALMLAQTPEYAVRARAVAETLNGLGALNICGEWNAHSHYLPHVRARFNQTLFGAVYGVSALLQLMRGGADAEMLWTGTDHECGYGVLDKDARPTPLFYAKALCTRHIRYGDWTSFPRWEPRRPELDTVIAHGDDGQRSALIVHLRDELATYSLSDLQADLSDCRTMLILDRETGNGVRCRPADGTVRFAGYGVAVVTNADVGFM